MALTSSGYVFTWGSTEYGQLGHGNKSKRKYLTTPCLVEGFRDHNVIQIIAGFDHCALIVELLPFVNRSKTISTTRNTSMSSSWSKVSPSMPISRFFLRKVATSQPCFGTI